jgi:hypothetical protein
MLQDKMGRIGRQSISVQSAASRGDEMDANSWFGA